MAFFLYAPVAFAVVAVPVAAAVQLFEHNIMKRLTTIVLPEICAGTFPAHLDFCSFRSH